MAVDGKLWNWFQNLQGSTTKFFKAKKVYYLKIATFFFYNKLIYNYLKNLIIKNNLKNYKKCLCKPAQVS